MTTGTYPLPTSATLAVPSEAALRRWPTLGRLRADAETQQHWRRAGYWTDETLGRVLEQRASSLPHMPAVITAEGEYTFAELQARSSAAARTLLAAGVRPGDVVSWMLATGPDAIAVAAAIWRIGAVSSPIVPLSGVREMTNILAQVRPTVIVAAAEHRGRTLPAEFDTAIADSALGDVARLVVGGASTGWRDAFAEGPGSVPEVLLAVNPFDPCLILFTSGTESAAKGVLHSSAGLQHELRSTITEWGITFRDRMFMASPLTHITGLLQGFLIPARVGASAVLMDRWNGAEGMELVESTGATYMAGAAPFLRELLAAYRASGRDRSSLRQYCCGGAAVSPDLIEGIGEFGVAGYRLWGMTELPTSTLANELDTMEHRAHTDGQIAPGVSIRTVDGDATLGVDEVGELHLRGPEMMLGYVDPDHNERVFTEDGWLRTGDLGAVDADGWVRVTGRIKEVINRGGEKFSAREIEDAVTTHPDIEAAAVVAVQGGRLGEQIAVAVVTRRADLTLAEIGQAVTGAGLSKHKQPERVLLVDSLPTNPTGKTDKRRVVELFEVVD